MATSADISTELSQDSAVVPGTLYVVATPLGNLEDITLRALRVLKQVDRIAAEDTRHSRKLLTHYGIATPLTSYYDQVEVHKAPQLVAALRRGHSIALISDAGTPCIADPGYRLVAAAIAAGIRVEPVPGASAVAAALSVAGLPTDRFAFEGFVPARPAARRLFFAAQVQESRTLIVYEAARRLAASLRALRAMLGNRRVVVARELTKLHEEIVRGSVDDVLAALAARHTQALRGEVTLLIAGGAGPPPPAAEALAAAIQRLRAEGLSLKDISRMLARERGLSRREVYRVALAMRPDGEET